MGCKPSKGSTAAIEGSTESGKPLKTQPSSTPTSSPRNNRTGTKGSQDESKESAVGDGGRGNSTPSKDDTEEVSDSHVYKLLVKAQAYPSDESLHQKIIASCLATPSQAKYQNRQTGSTPLHLACRLLESVSANQAPSSPASSAAGHSMVPNVIESLLQAHPQATRVPDAAGNFPLHYAIAPAASMGRAQSPKNNRSPRSATSPLSNSSSPRSTASDIAAPNSQAWSTRTEAVSKLMRHDPQTSQEYFARSNVVFDRANEGCSPLYRALETLPDDFDGKAPTVEFIRLIRGASEPVIAVGNSSDADTPLALLYRRFTRQFDLAEKFFSGDNSRPEVVQHRSRYKIAAGNTWKIIELLLKPMLLVTDLPSPTAALPHEPSLNPSSSGPNNWRIVHRAVQVETPPDLLRYIVETNAEDLTVMDEYGNLPLHYAAKSKPPQPQEGQEDVVHFPAFYTKYVVDELLYKFPEAASMKDAKGNYPFTLAVRAGKQWIGGGIKSLYDAYPEALQQVDLQKHVALKRVLSLEPSGATQLDDEDDVKEEKVDGDDVAASLAASTIIRDEQHDAIMLVQQPDVEVQEVVTSMWAHEEDAGVQMLGCVAIANMIQRTPETSTKMAYVLRIALFAVAGVVNAMKAHPNEVIVQEKACLALQLLAVTDCKREISFVASGAVAAIVGAMQAHVADANVQKEACFAIANIIHFGGDDRATVVASVSGLTAIVNAIAAHPKDASVQQAALTALRELTDYCTTANLPELPRSQTEPLLNAAKKLFPEECGQDVEILLARLS